MPLQTIISSAGPLPLNEIFTPSADGPVVFVVTATAWSTSAPGKIGIEVYLNGVAIGSATMFANQNSVHMTLPTMFLNATIPSNQPQKISITALGNTVTDINDNFVVQLLV
jgi:hypothetical protein